MTKTVDVRLTVTVGVDMIQEQPWDINESETDSTSKSVKIQSNYTWWNSNLANFDFVSFDFNRTIALENISRCGGRGSNSSEGRRHMRRTYRLWKLDS